MPGATSYNWTVPTGWTITGGAGTNAITVSTTASAVSGNITVTATNSCGTSNAQTFPVTVSTATPATPGAITGSQNICPVVSLVYSITAVPNATNYTWNVPSGWTITAGQGTTSITTTAGASATSGNITVTASNACGTSAASTLSATVGSFATANAGPDQTICAGQTVQLTGVVGGAINPNPNNNYIWSQSPAGSGTFSPTNGPSPVFTPNAAGIAAGTITITLTTPDPSGACGPASDQMIITIRPTPTASISGPTTICSGSSTTITFTGTANTTVTYTVSGVGGSSTINIGASGTATLTTPALTANTTYTLTNVAYSTAPTCSQTASGSAVVTVNTNPTVNAGTDQTVCASNPNVTLAGSITGSVTTGTWSGGAGSFAPNNTTLNAVYTPTAAEITAGTVTLTLTSADPAGPCGPVTDQMVITITPAATANAGVDQAVCASSPNVTLAGVIGGSATSATWSGGAGTFAPNNTTLSAVYTPTAAEITAGTVTLTLTTNDPTGPCGAATDQMVITINPSATANANADQTVCASSPNVTLAGSIGGGATTGTWSGGGGTFSPSATTLNAIYTPTAAEITSGTVTLTLTTDDPPGQCGAATDQMTITINPVATANANADQTVCASSPNVTLAGTVGGSATSGTWSGGGGTFNPGANALNATYTPTAAEITAGTVTLTLTTNDPAGPCGTATDQMIITIEPVATVSAGPNFTICSNGTATMAGSFGGGATSGTWSTSGSGSFSNNTPTAVYTPSAADITAGTVTLTYTTNDPAGPCSSATASMTLTINEAVVITTQPSNVSVCATFPADLNVVAIGDGLIYQWYKGTPPTGTALVNGPNITGAQSPNLHFNQATLADDGNYYVVISGASPCTPVTSAVRTLNVDQAINITTQPQSQQLCVGFNVTFTVVADANGEPLTYQWRKNGAPISGQTTSTLTINNITSGDAGNYDVVITGPAGFSCSSVQSTVAVLTVNPLPTITGTLTVCVGSTTQLIGSGTPAVSNPWVSATPAVATVNSTGLVTGVAAGTSVITYTNNNGCSITATVTVNPTPTVNATPASQTICSGTAITQIDITNPNAVAGTTFGWTRSNTANLTGIAASGSGASINGTLTNTTATAQTTTFTITATAGSCTSTTTVTVTVDPTPTINATNTNQTICSGASIADIVITNPNGVAGTTLSWTRNNTANLTGIAASGTGSPISGTLTNTTATAQTTTFTITATAGSCSSTTTATITVNPTPTVNATPASQTICSGTAITQIDITNPNAVAGTTLSWTRNNTANLTGIAASGSGASINGTLTNTTATAQTTTFTITASAGSCTSTTTITVTVDPTPTINATNTNQTICSGAAIANIVITNPNGVAGTTLSWTRNNTANLTGIAASGTGSPISGTLTNTTATAQTTTFTITATAGSCSSTTTATITVNPTPTVNATPASQTICSGTAITQIDITNPNAVAGTTFSWTRNNTANLTGIAASGSGASINGTLTNTTATAQTTTFTITAAVGSCTSTTTVTVTVDPTPTINATNTNQTICSGAAIANIVITNPNGVAGTTLSWTRNNTANLTGIAASGTGSPISGTLTNTTATAQTTTFTITATAGSCSSTTTATITVNPTPTVNATPASQTICSGTAITQIDITNPNAVAGTTFSWTRNNTVNLTGIGASGSGASITGTLTNTTTAAQTTTFTITAAVGSCTSTTTVTVTVNPKPTVTVSPTTATICNGNSTTLTASGATTYAWSPATGLSSPTGATVTANPATTTTYTVTGTDGNGCTSTATTTVTVNPQPTITVTPSSATICSGSSVSLTASGATTYSWSPATGLSSTSGATVTANPTSTITYTVTGTVATGCTNTTTVTITVNANPTGGTISPATSTGCPGANSGTLTLSGYSGNIIRWESSTTGGTTPWDPIANTTNTLTYTNITQTTLYRAVLQSNGCTSYSSNAVVTIIPQQAVTATANPTVVCPGQPSVLTGSGGIPVPTGGITGGDFNNGNPDGWCVDGQCSGSFLPANGNNTDLGPWRETNDHTFFGIFHDDIDGKFAIANGIRTSIMTTAAFSLIGQSPASLDFFQAYNLCAGASVTIDISTNGGITYPTTLAQYTGPTSLGFAGTTSTLQSASISLANYIGLSNLKLRFTYTGTCNNNYWTLDGLALPGTITPVTTTWTATDGTVITATAGATQTVTPTVTTSYTLTVSMAGCVIGTAQVTVTVAPEPVVTTVNSCVGGSPVTFTQTGAPGGGTWTVSGGGTITNAGVFTPTTAGCFTAIYRTPGPGCADTVNFVVFPVPVLSVPANTCNTAFTIINVPAVTGFTAQYSIDGGAFSATPTIPTTPGCHTIQAQYVLTANCGLTLAGATLPCALSNIVSVVIYPPAPPAPVVSPGCGAFTVDPPPTITGFDIQYSFDDGASWGTNTPPTADNCTGYRIRTRYVTSAICGTTPAGTASTIAGCIASPATVRVVDRTAPVITGTYANVALACNPIASDITAALGTATATDACSTPTITFSDGTVQINSCTSSQTRIFTVTDACGNTATVTRTVTWTADITPPTITGVGANGTIECPATPTFSSPTASDGCSTPTLTFADVTTSGACVTEYSIRRTWTARDGCGNTATAAQTITVEDNTLPTISGVGADATIQCPATPTFSSPTASDGCSTPTLTFADITTPGACATEYSIRRTWTANDGCGNTITATQTITVEDNTLPTISGVGADATIQCPATPTFSSPTASDGCSTPTLTFADVTTPGACATEYSIRRTWTANDGCGNMITAAQTITVEDNTLPTISGVGADATIQCPATPTFSSPTASDGCSTPTLTFADVTTQGVCATEYSIRRTWTANDGCGNTISGIL